MLDALAAPRAPELDDAALDAWLRARAVAWARAAGGDTAPLQVRETVELRDALRGHDGPVILVATDVPALGAHHLAAARDDLAAGVLLSEASTGDGSPFLVALSATDDELLDAVGAAFNDVLGLAAARSGELGMIRAERRLATLSDAHAALVDPLTPPALRALLGPLTADA